MSKDSASVAFLGDVCLRVGTVEHIATTLYALN